MWLAFGVVGWFAPSTMNRAWIRCAFAEWITSPMALGISTSHGSSRISSLETSRVPGKPSTVFVSPWWRSTAGTSSPFGS